MKKTIAWTLTMVMLAMMTGCRINQEQPETPESQPASSVQQTEMDTTQARKDEETLSNDEIIGNDGAIILPEDEFTDAVTEPVETTVSTSVGKQTESDSTWESQIEETIPNTEIILPDDEFTEATTEPATEPVEITETMPLETEPEVTETMAPETEPEVTETIVPETKPEVIETMVTEPEPGITEDNDTDSGIEVPEDEF